jgi:glutamate-5-semialdehyde dehydrogenase
VAALTAEGVELRGCAETRRRHPELKAATGADWDTEYLAPILSIRRVPGLEGALQHIARHGSRHTESIVTGGPSAAERFLAAVDAACVFHNASTRFSMATGSGWAPRWASARQAARAGARGRDGL